MNYSEEQNNKKRKEYKSPKKKIRSKASVLVFRIFLAIVLIGGFAALGAGAGVYLSIIENSPKLEPLAMKPSIYPSIIYYDDGTTESVKLKGEENRKYVTFDKIPQDLKDAFVAIEDERFYSHNGIDIKGMARALVTIIKTKGERQEGASTITQQLIKNNVRKMSKNTITTKLQEQYLAVEYEKKMIEQYGTKESAKDHILELYMNSINMHYSLYGVQTASEFYFKKPVSDLNLTEAAVIAAITQNPAKNAPIRNPEKNWERVKLILNKMLELEMITQKEHDDAIADDVYARVSTQATVTEDNNSFYSYFDDALLNAVVEALQEKYKYGSAEAFHYVYNGGLKIYGTQNKKMQDIMNESFLNDNLFPKSGFKIDVQYDVAIKNGITEKVEDFHKEATVKTVEDIAPLVESFRSELLGANDSIVPGYEKIIPIPQPQAAMVITDFHNGQVKALAGGRGEKLTNLALNRAVDSTRQPGSVFKVLASFAPSIDLGLNTDTTIIDDAPFEYKGWAPKNWYGGYRGPQTIRTAIKNSMNVITVKNMVNTGIEECYKYLKNFGFKTLVDGEVINGSYKTDIGAATCLGGITLGVTQIDLASAYGTIANDGEYNTPILYTKVLDQDGTIILENLYEPRQVLKKQTAVLLTDIMRDVITSGTGGKARFKNIKMPQAGKTGTTTDTIDLMFAGYTPYYVASIWLGYDHPEAMKEDKGYHMLLWSDVMEKIHENLPIKEFEKPVQISTTAICTLSGKLAIAGICDEDPRGGFVKNTFSSNVKVTDYCDLHVAASVCTVSGMKAGSYCPPEDVERHVGVVNYSTNTEHLAYDILPEWVKGQVCTIHVSEPIIMDPSALYPDLDFAPVLPDEPQQTNSPQPNTTLPTMENTPQPTRSTQPMQVFTPQPLPNSTPSPIIVVPEPTPKPLVMPEATETPQPILLPDLPTIDDPQTVDSFNY